MHRDFAKPSLNSEQKARIKELYKRDNYHGIIALSKDFTWVGMAMVLPVVLSVWLLPISIIIIGARQRSLASLLHEAAHGTLFLSTMLNKTLGRVLCGWAIFQSFGAYRESHVFSHHPKIGEDVDDPDLRYMLAEGVYNKQSRSKFIWRFVAFPLLGGRTFKYIDFLINDRLLGAFQHREHRSEVFGVVIVHASIASGSIYFGVFYLLCLFWWLPFIVVHPIIGWLSELSEHFPMMKEHAENPIYSSRNRYAGPIERLLIGMHGDNYHLTHHLLPGIPHWNLEKATQILREDDEFRAWDDTWGGILSSSGPARISLIEYIMNNHRFEAQTAPPRLSSNISCEAYS